MSRRRKLTLVLLAAVAGSLASPLSAADLAGEVHATGTVLNFVVMLTPPREESGPVLCSNDVAKRLRNLTSMTVVAHGEWTKVNQTDCFDAHDFTVTKSSVGRNVVVGVLTQVGGVYSLKGEDGKVRMLSDLTEGLKKLVGEKVILELRPMNSPAAKTTGDKIVSYSEFP